MSTRYISHSSQLPEISEDVKETIQKALSAGLVKIQQNRVGISGQHVYIGSAGIALTLLLASTSSETIQLADQILLSTITQARYPKDAAHASFLETGVGPATLVLERCISGTGNQRLWDAGRVCIKLLQHTLDLVQHSAVVNDDDGCEVLYGRAGFLYSLLRLRANITDQCKWDSAPEIRALVSDSSLTIVVESIIARGRFGASVYYPSKGVGPPPFTWSWHGKRYLGAAHGVAGILNVLLLCPSAVIAPYMPEITKTIELLVRQQDPDGNWPTKAGQKHHESNELVQWCHGATGILILLSTFTRRTTAPTTALPHLVSSISKAASLIYHHGLLRKGLGICHGVAGSVYALLSASAAFHILGDIEQKEKVFRRAVHLALLATSYEQYTKDGEMRVPDREMSLCEGLAGMCCAWKTVLGLLANKGEPEGGMPGFDEEFLFVN